MTTLLHRLLFVGFTRCLLCIAGGETGVQCGTLSRICLRGCSVNYANLSGKDRVIIHFGQDTEPTWIRWTKPSYQISMALQNFAIIYLIDITQLSDSNKIYKLSNPCSTLFFRNKHIMIHLGYRYNKINCAITCQKTLRDPKSHLQCTCKARCLIVSPRVYSTRQTVLVPKSWSELDCTPQSPNVHFYILLHPDLDFFTFNTPSPIES